MNNDSIANYQFPRCNVLSYPSSPPPTCKVNIRQCSQRLICTLICLTSLMKTLPFFFVFLEREGCRTPDILARSFPSPSSMLWSGVRGVVHVPRRAGGAEVGEEDH